QQTKLAAMEAMWETEPAPASFNLIAIPNEAEMKNDFAIHIPWLMGLIGTRSLDQQIPGIKDIVAHNRERIVSGISAVKALEQLRQDQSNVAAKAVFEKHKADLGFGLLLRKYTADVSAATPDMIDQAARSTIPKVAPMFWSFRVMVALGFAMLLLFGLALWYSIKGNFAEKTGFLRTAVWCLPMPWIACEVGWFVAEYGRQPWTIYGVLPTHLSVSTLSPASLYGSLAGFIAFYTVLLIVEMYLMIRFAKQGPGSLGTGRYLNEAIAH
nr:cytochrome ubiquinol oxidase subunit I [Aquaspirillum sp.]